MRKIPHVLHKIVGTYNMKKNEKDVLLPNEVKRAKNFDIRIFQCILLEYSLIINRVFEKYKIKAFLKMFFKNAYLFLHLDKSLLFLLYRSLKYGISH